MTSSGQKVDFEGFQNVVSRENITRVSAVRSRKALTSHGRYAIFLISKALYNRQICPTLIGVDLRKIATDA